MLSCYPWRAVAVHCVRGQYFEKHLKFIRHNESPVSFTELDLSYLLKVRCAHKTFSVIVDNTN